MVGAGGGVVVVGGGGPWCTVACIRGAFHLVCAHV